MPCFYDVTSGPLADRVIDSLNSCCTIQSLLNISKKGQLFYNPSRPLVPHCISLQYLEEYADAAGVPVSYYLFDSSFPPIPQVSSYDREVIWALDHMLGDKLITFFEAVKICFPNSTYTSVTSPSVSYRLRHLISLWHYGAIIERCEKLQDSPDPASQIVCQELSSYRASHYSNRFAFSSNALVEMAQYVGVSLHWLFNFKRPFYCHTQLADEIFDYYSLLDPKQQILFYRFLNGEGGTIYE